MRILHIVPEFEEGGVERHVLWLSKELISKGHEVGLATAGGKLVPQLPEEVRVLRLPVHRKSPFTGLWCVARLAMERGRWDLLHAHSRVPAWIAWWTSALTGVPWIMTAHAQYSLNMGIAPLRHARGVICVSDAVMRHLVGCLPPRARVILNGLRTPSVHREANPFSQDPRFLFVGRLTEAKGLDVALRALAGLRHRAWTLDVVGDGAQRGEWEALVAELDIKERVTFHGFRDDAEAWMARADCLLFPSYEEGLPLVVLEALSVGLPILASDIEPLRPLASGPLIPPGDVAAWREAILRVLNDGPASPLSVAGLPTHEEMARDILAFYEEIL